MIKLGVTVDPQQNGKILVGRLAQWTRGSNPPTPHGTSHPGSSASRWLYSTSTQLSLWIHSVPLTKIQTSSHRWYLFLASSFFNPGDLYYLRSATWRVSDLDGLIDWRLQRCSTRCTCSPVIVGLQRLTPTSSSRCLELTTARNDCRSFSPTTRRNSHEIR